MYHEEKILPWIRPDGKSQVTVQIEKNTENPPRISTVVIASQHAPDAGPNWPDSNNLTEVERRMYIEGEIRKHIIEHAIPESLLNEPEIIVNGTGSFPDPGGPYADAGLTGRKIIVDTYGGGRHGGDDRRAEAVGAHDAGGAVPQGERQIGRASCRERV